MMGLGVGSAAFGPTIRDAMRRDSVELAERPDNRGMLVGLGLAGLGLLVWILVLVTLARLDGSDAARARGMIETGGLWLVLAAMGFVAYAMGRLSKAAIGALLVL